MLRRRRKTLAGVDNTYLIKTIQIQTVVLTAFHFCVHSRGNTSNALLVQWHNCLNKFKNNNKVVNELEVFNG